MPTTISFDLDNTLWNVDEVIRGAERTLTEYLAETSPDVRANYTAENLERVRAQVLEAHPEYVHDLSFMRTQVLTKLFEDCGYNELEARRRAQESFDIFFHARNQVTFFPGALEALTELSESYRLCALTNGNADIHRVGLSSYMSGAVSSAEAGVKKPAVQIYEYFLNKFDVSAHEVLHVGDHLVDDIQGAKGAGIRSVWVNLTDQARLPEDSLPDAEVNQLDELATTIKELLS